MITITDVLNYKPSLEKTSGIDKRPDALDKYINSSIIFVENEMRNLNIDLDDLFLINNVSYKNVFLQYFYYLYIESCNTIKPSRDDLRFVKLEYNKYLEFLNKFRTIFENNKNDINDKDKSLINNINLIFG